MPKSVLVDITCNSWVKEWRGGLPETQGEVAEDPLVVVMEDPLESQPHWSLYLDDEEKSRLSAIKRSDVRQAKLAAHVLLRVLLSKIHGGHPRSHALTRDHLGRPRPRNLPSWSCSLSHDPYGVAVAVGRNLNQTKHLGIDLCRPLDRFDGLSFVLHESEKKYLNMKRENNATDMARFWASKEALLKRWGWGLIPRMDRISTIPGQKYLCTFDAPMHAQPAVSSMISSRILKNGAVVALAHHPNQVAEWWRTNAAELDKAARES